MLLLPSSVHAARRGRGSLGGHGVRPTGECHTPSMPLNFTCPGVTAPPAQRPVPSVADVLPLVGNGSQRVAQGDVGRRRDRHPQAADRLPQTGHQVSKARNHGAAATPLTVAGRPRLSVSVLQTGVCVTDRCVCVTDRFKGFWSQCYKNKTKMKAKFLPNSITFLAKVEIDR